VTDDPSFFVGRHVVVTGGGRGIGRAIATAFGERGATVHVVSLSATCRDVAEGIIAAGGRARAYVGSVTDEDFCKSTLEAVAEEGDGPDVLINAAATIGEHGPFLQMSMEAFAATLEVNLLGTCHFMRWALPTMINRCFGRIVNFAGGGAAYAYPNFTAYGASKVAVVRLTETVAAEISVPGVTVYVIAPGAVETDMLAQVRAAGGEVRTVTQVEEPVRLVLFLAGPDSGHITGRFLHVRDRYDYPQYFEDRDMFTLRRVEDR
jgi:NAD(P)-dependent dehydrogenase (short-subunit alcohol dehydrogenase family)